MSGGTYAWLVYVPRHRRLNIHIFLSLANLANYSHKITHLYDHKMLESYFIQICFFLVIIGTVWHLFSNFEIKIKIKVVFGIFYPPLEKFKRVPLKIEDKKNLSTIAGDR